MSALKTLWHVVKVDAVDGLRIGITEADSADGLEILSDSPLSEDDASNMSIQLSKQLGIPQFDNGVDLF